MKSIHPFASLRSHSACSVQGGSCHSSISCRVSMAASPSVDCNTWDSVRMDGAATTQLLPATALVHCLLTCFPAYTSPRPTGHEPLRRPFPPAQTPKPRGQLPERLDDRFVPRCKEAQVRRSYSKLRRLHWGAGCEPGPD